MVDEHAFQDLLLTNVFLMYLNDFGLEVGWDRDILLHVHCVYNTSLLAVQSLQSDLRHMIEEVLQFSDGGFQNNNLLLNKTKTKIILFISIHSNI